MRLTKRSNSTNWFLEARINGKSFVRSTKTSHKPTAKIIADELFRTIQVEAVKGPSKDISFKDASDRYLEASKGMPSSKNLHGVAGVILKIFDGNLLLSQITGKHLSDFVDRRKAQGLLTKRRSCSIDHQ